MIELASMRPDVDQSADPSHIRHGFLDDSDVEDWIHQEGRFTASSPTIPGSSPSGIRLLLCERVGWQPLGFPMSRASFEAAEAAFGLPRATLPLLSRNSGVEYYKLGIGPSGNGHQELHSVCKS
jgi:hypothetical protein